MQARNRFIKGTGGVYKCKCCGRSTRSTGNGDNEFVRMCEQCYEIGGIENSLCDGQYENEAEKQSMIDEIKALAVVIAVKGGVVQSDWI